jgi:hypothetical protein
MKFSPPLYPLPLFIHVLIYSIKRGYTLLLIGNLIRSYNDLRQGQNTVQLIEKVYKAIKRTFKKKYSITLNIIKFYNIAL